MLNKYYPYIDFKLIFKTDFTIGSFFNHKEKLPIFLRSSLIYQFTCPRCSLDYIGCTSRHLKTRVCEHLGVSHRTLQPLRCKSNSAIRSHCDKCKFSFNINNFKILKQAPDHHSLLILESMYIKNLNPSLNTDSSSYSLVF